MIQYLRNVLSNYTFSHTPANYQIVDAVCSNCWSIIHPSLTISDMTFHDQQPLVENINRRDCPFCHAKHSIILLDHGMTEITRQLNLKKYKTEYTCESHEYKIRTDDKTKIIRNNAYVLFDRQYRELFESLPPRGWAVYSWPCEDAEDEFTGFTRVMLEWDHITLKPKLGSLLNWVNLLPIASGENVGVF